MKYLINKFMNQWGYNISKLPKPSLSNYDNFSEDSLLNKRFYNIGSGSFKHPYWTNIDYETDHYKAVQKSNFINCDLMDLKPLPIDSGKAELIYSSHTIEHVSDDAVRNMFNESFRILKPGGGIRITTPDAWLEFQAYKNNDTKQWYWIDNYSKKGTWEKLYKSPLNKASIHQIFLHHFASELTEISVSSTSLKKYSDDEIIDIFSRNSNVETLDFFTKQCKFNSNHPGNHINWWTHEKVISFLENSGFKQCYRSGWCQSLFPPLRDTNLFDRTHPKISLFVEAMK